MLPQDVFNEYDYEGDKHRDRPEDWQILKNLKRQENFHKIIQNNPVIVEADPNLLSIDKQPKFDILVDKPIRYKKKTKMRTDDN